MAGDAKGNGSWLKVVSCVMTAVTLFSTGWAASATVAWISYHKMDQTGTQKAQQLESRVVRIETTLDVTLRQMNDNLKSLQTEMIRHMQLTAGQPRVGDGG